MEPFVIDIVMIPAFFLLWRILDEVWQRAL